MEYTLTQKQALIRAARDMGATLDGQPAVFALGSSDGAFVKVAAINGPRESYTWEEFAYIVATGARFQWGQHWEEEMWSASWAA